MTQPDHVPSEAPAATAAGASLRLPLALAAVAVALRLGIALASGFQVDDAWITYRYAENLAAGEGFVYNPGERVYGTTTPLLTLLLAGAAAAGVPLPAASLALALAATAATLLALYALVAPRLGRPWAVLLLGLVAVAPGHVVWSVSGMETALAVAFQAAAVLAYARRRWTLLGLAGAGALLTRIDAVVLLGALAATEVVVSAVGRARREPARGPLRAAAVLALAAAPWLVFAALYFGDVVPNSVWAKTGLHRGLSLERVPALLRGALDVGLAPFPVEVGLAALGIVALLRRERLLVVPLWLGGQAAFLTLGRVHLHPWYLAPFHPWLLVAWTFGLARAGAWLADAAERRGGGGVARLSGRAATVLALTVPALAGVASVPAALVDAQSRQAAYERAHAAIGRLLAARSRPGERIYAWDIGYVGSLTGRPILDFQGIVSPEVIPYNRRGAYAAVLEDFRPAWAVVGLYGSAAREVLGSPAVRRLYREVWRNTHVGPESVLGSSDPRPYGAEYVVLRRRDAPE